MRRRERGQTWAWSITSDVSDAALFPKSKSKPLFSLGIHSDILSERRASTSVDIVSIRAGEVYTENADPVNGHRLLIQALVKFDTTQASTSHSSSLLTSSLTGPRSENRHY